MGFFALHLAHTFLQFTLHSMRYTHLSVRVDRNRLIVYSDEGGMETVRAQLLQFCRHGYILSVANHRGRLQRTPYTGSLDELLPILTGKLGFALSRWPEPVPELAARQRYST